jgi:hypothetical protein
MIEKITKRLRNSDRIGVFHNTRGDVVLLARMVNMLIDKNNELIDEINELKKEND